MALTKFRVKDMSEGLTVAHIKADGSSTPNLDGVQSECQDLWRTIPNWMFPRVVSELRLPAQVPVKGPQSLPTSWSQNPNRAVKADASDTSQNNIPRGPDTSLLMNPGLKTIYIYDHILIYMYMYTYIYLYKGFWDRMPEF